MSALLRNMFVTLFCLSFSTAFATQYPLTMTDSMGNTITLQQAPQRISSKTLFSDELLLSLVPVSRLTSLTSLANDGNFSNIADHVPEGIPLLDLNVERIIANAPDIVFAANWSDAGQIAQLKQVGIPVYLIQTPFTLDGIRAEIEKIAALVDAEAEGEQVLTAMDKKLDALAPKIANIAAQNWVALDYNTWGTSNGKASTWQAILDSAQVSNGVADFSANDFGQVTMSKELILDINPDILVLPGWIYGDEAGADAFYNQVINDPALQSVAAVRSNRIMMIPERLRGTYSQYLVDTIEYVVNALHDTIQ